MGYLGVDEKMIYSMWRGRWTDKFCMETLNL